MLIVFPIGPGIDRRTACDAAVAAAVEAQQAIEDINRDRCLDGKPEIGFGVGLNTGEVIYGNVGAPDRLDFTVMGPSVNRAARLESLTKQLGQSILFSEAFAQCIDWPCRSLGIHEMKGIAAPVSVYALSGFARPG